MAVAIDLVDLAVWGGADVQPAVRRGRERVGFELRGVEEEGALALGVDLEHLAFVAGAREQRPVRARDQRPEEGRRRFVHQLGRGPEHELAMAIDREALDIAFQEVGLRRRLEELR